MNHVNEGLLQAYLDGELDGEASRAVESHLGDCIPCRGEMSELRAMADEFSGALLLLEAPAVPVARAYTVAFPKREARVWTRRASALPRAAALVLLVSGAAAAMIPGSPLYDLLRPAPEPVEVAATVAPAASATAAAEQPPAAKASVVEAGVSVEPVDGVVTVVLSDADPDLQIRALLTESSRAGVYATGAVAGARFDAGPGRIEVVGTGAGELRIEIPRGALAATVVVNDLDYLVKRGDLLQLTTPQGGQAGAEVTFRP